MPIHLDVTLNLVITISFSRWRGPLSKENQCPAFRQIRGGPHTVPDLLILSYLQLKITLVPKRPMSGGAFPDPLRHGQLAQPRRRRSGLAQEVTAGSVFELSRQLPCGTIVPCSGEACLLHCASV